MHFLIVGDFWNRDISSRCFTAVEFKQEEFGEEDPYNMLASNLSSTDTRFNGSVNLESQE